MVRYVKINNRIYNAILEKNEKIYKRDIA